MKKPALIFLHIPKTAGTTMRTVIARQFREDAIMHIDTKSHVDEFKKLPMEAKRAKECFMGHAVRFGIHAYLPGPANYITVFRHPVERAVSFYYYALYKNWHPLHNEIVSKKLRLEDCLVNIPDFSNEQVRYVADADRPRIADLEIAKKNLMEPFFVFGLIEQFTESMVLFKELLNWRRAFFIDENRFAERPSSETLPKGTISLIEKYNALDLELYEFAKKEFAKLSDRHGRPLEKRVKRFRRSNRAYGFYRLVITKSGLIKIPWLFNFICRQFREFRREGVAAAARKFRVCLSLLGLTKSKNKNDK